MGWCDCTALGEGGQPRGSSLSLPLPVGLLSPSAQPRGTGSPERKLEPRSILPQGKRLGGRRALDSRLQPAPSGLSASAGVHIADIGSLSLLQNLGLSPKATCSDQRL